MHVRSKMIATCLYGAALLLASTPSVCLAQSNVTSSNLLYEPKNLKPPRRYNSKICARDSANLVVLNAALAIASIPPDLENYSEVLEGYVKGIRECATDFIRKLDCSTIREDVDNGGRNDAAPAPKRGAYRGIAITPGKCCRDVNAIREMAKESTEGIASLWLPPEDGTPDVKKLQRVVERILDGEKAFEPSPMLDEDGTYGLEVLRRMVELSMFDDERRRFTSVIEDIGSVYIRELGIEPGSSCLSPSEY
eukprot:CAMPEP_0197461312 /NCGR_PEP_ID=MMETSP1175-20131217/56170_1 /TAXON_ID=1003142 /ORGANISM="Triceratium dubium, Strain CCMP147" /LENGTH=250 /DNA_ID=CAMNT_0042996563 /DNA_START=132 /DNA_END=884 /DNA_ORIENTATION=+